MSTHSAESKGGVEHGYGVGSDCLCGRNFAKVRGLREHLTKTRLRMIEHSTPPEVGGP